MAAQVCPAPCFAAAPETADAGTQFPEPGLLGKAKAAKHRAAAIAKQSTRRFEFSTLGSDLLVLAKFMD